MSDDDHDEHDASSIDRRRALKSLGAGVAATTLGVGTASAKRALRGDVDGEIPWEYESIQGREKIDLLWELVETPAFEQLRTVVNSRGGTLRGLPGHSEAARLTANGTTRAVVSIEVQTDSERDAYLNIGRDDGEEVSVANVTYNTYAEDGILRKQEKYDVLASASADAPTASAVSVESTAGPAVKKTIEPEQAVRSALEETRSDGPSERISTQGLGDGACDECR